MPPTVFCAALAQETNAFGPLPTGLESFSGRFAAGEVTSSVSPPFPECLRDSLEKRRAMGRLQLVEGPMAGAHPSGPVTRHAYEALRDALLSALEAAGEVDIVVLHLHGAMTADGYPDCEGDLLTRIRSSVGRSVIVGAMLDPHAHLSAAMVDATDLLIAYKEYPHTDFRERAEELVTGILAVHAGQVRPVAALWDSGVIAVFHTNLPPVRRLVERMQSWERSGKALSASLIHGFPWGDGPDLGTRALVYCDADRQSADDLAHELAETAQQLATEAIHKELDLEAALARLWVQTGSRPVVWADCADNPGGGAAGDSTHVLAHLLAHRVDNACLGPLWDPGAVAIAFDAGVGARLPMRIGGKTGPQSGAALDVDVEVTALCADGSQSFAGARFPLGRTAALRCAGVDVVIASRRDQARGTDLFTHLGIQPSERRLIVVKSSQHFYDSFAPIASQVVYLNCPGSLQSDLRKYAYRHVSRPRWPLDDSLPASWRVALSPPG